MARVRSGEHSRRAMSKNPHVADKSGLPREN